MWKNRETGQELHESQLEQMYMDCLDEVYGEAVVCGAKFQSSHAIRKLDPTAYRCNFLDWLDASDWEEL